MSTSAVVTTSSTGVELRSNTTTLVEVWSGRFSVVNEIVVLLRGRPPKSRMPKVSSATTRAFSGYWPNFGRMCSIVASKDCSSTMSAGTTCGGTTVVTSLVEPQL